MPGNPLVHFIAPLDTSPTRLGPASSYTTRGEPESPGQGPDLSSPTTQILLGDIWFRHSLKYKQSGTLNIKHQQLRFQRDQGYLPFKYIEKYKNLVGHFFLAEWCIHLKDLHCDGELYRFIAQRDHTVHTDRHRSCYFYMRIVTFYCTFYIRGKLFIIRCEK